MSQQILLTTTGTLSPVIINDLGSRTFIHPVSGYDLLQEYRIEEIRDSLDLQAAIDAGYITLTDDTLSPIPNLKNDLENAKLRFDENRNNTVDNASNLNSQSPSFYLDRTNHTGFQSAATISNFNSAVTGIINANGTAGWAINSANTYLLNSQNSSFYLDRTNHTSTQTVATISDLDVNGTAGFALFARNATSDRILYVKKNPAVGEYLTIEDALNAIPPANTLNFGNQYLISVGAGTFVENQLNVKPYVSIVGTSIQETIVTPAGDHDLFVFTDVFTEICFMSLQSTMPGRAAIFINDSGNYAQLHKVNFVDCDINVYILSQTQDTVCYMEYCDVNGQMTYGIIVEANNGFTAFCNTENWYTFPSNAIGFIANYVHGPGSILTINTAGIYGVSYPDFGTAGLDLNGSGILAFDGAVVRVSGAEFIGWNEGLCNENTGAPADIQLLGSIFDQNNLDICILHPQTVGGMLGTAAVNKVEINPDNTTWTPTFNNSQNEGGIYIVGGIFAGPTAATVTNISESFSSNPVGLIQGGVLTDGTNGTCGLCVSISEGTGYVDVNGFFKYITWPESHIYIGPNSSEYVYVDVDMNFQTSLSFPDAISNIILGRVRTLTTHIEFIDLSPLQTYRVTNFQLLDSRDVDGARYNSGSVVTENATALHLDVSSGRYYFFGNRYSPSGGINISFNTYYRDGASGWIILENQNIVSNTQYDNNSGVLQNLTSLHYAKHLLLVVGDGDYEKYFIVYGQAQYSLLNDVTNAPLPGIPMWFIDSVVKLASIIVQEGSANIITILSERPFPLAQSSSSFGVTDHGSLTGLLDDDHPQYLLVSGTRSMSGNLDLNSNNIINVGTINSVTIQTHASRHLPNGADPIAVGIPVSVGTSNAEGIANSLARQDHVHAHGNQTGPTQHAVATQIANGFMSAADKLKLDGGTAGYALNAGLAFNASNLNSQPGSFYLNRANHTSTQVAATISDFNSVVTGIVNANGTSGWAIDSAHSFLSDTATNSTLLNNNNAAFYLSRTNHTGTQVAATISDFNSVVTGIVNANGTSGWSTNSAHSFLSDTATNATLLNNNNASFYLSRINHTGTQVAATISDFNSVVTGIINANGTSGWANNSAHSFLSDTATNSTLLNNQNASFYLSRTNHTGTQTAATISDFVSVSQGIIGQFGTSAWATNSAHSFLSDTATNATLLNNNNAAFYLSRTNHTGTQTAATISDFNSVVTGIVNANGTSGWAANSAHSFLSDTATNSTLLNNNNAAFYLSRTNHTGTQTAATISDFVSVSQGIIGQFGTSAWATNAGLLQSQNGAYYLSRTNHTGTQVAATISDFVSVSNGIIAAFGTAGWATNSGNAFLLNNNNAAFYLNRNNHTNSFASTINFDSNINVKGDVNLQGNLYSTSGISTPANMNSATVTSGNITSTGTIVAPTVRVSGQIFTIGNNNTLGDENVQGKVYATSGLSTPATLLVSGNSNLANVAVSGNINLTGQFFANNNLNTILDINATGRIYGTAGLSTPANMNSASITTGVISTNNSIFITGTGKLNGTAGIATDSLSTYALASATTDVNVAASAAPTAGQILIATSATTATWQTMFSNSVNSTSNTTFTATSYATGINGSLTLTPASGTYLVEWSSSISHGAGSASINGAVHAGGTINTASERVFTNTATSAGLIVCFGSSAVVTVNGAQAIEVRFIVSSGTGTLRLRSMTIIKIA